jgi:hypothetical protein
MTNEEFIQSIALEGEEWRDVIGYEGFYIVSNLGRIATIRDSYTYTKNGKTFTKSWPRHICSTSIAPSTHYERMTFKVNYKHDTQLVHRIVAEAFLPNPNNFTCIDHIDDNPSNNRVDNLQWCNHHINNSKPRHRKLSSIAKMGRVDPKRKPVVAIKDDTVLVYPSINSVETNGHSRSAVTRVIQNKLKTHHGFQWMYLSDYESLINKSKNSLPVPITSN